MNEPTKTTVTLTFKDLESLDFWEYATSQGSLFTWQSDKPALTVTISSDMQADDDQQEDFQDNWGQATQESLDSDDPEWQDRLGITQATVTH